MDVASLPAARKGRATIPACRFSQVRLGLTLSRHEWTQARVGRRHQAELERGGKPRLQLVRWGMGGQFFEASGIGRQTSSHFQPVAGRLSPRYGARRHPILG